MLATPFSDEATAYDPAVLVEPWKERTQTLWLTDREIEESPRCEDRDLDLIKDGSHHDNPALAGRVVSG